MNVTIGSLRSEDLSALEDLELLPEDLSTDAIAAPRTTLEDSTLMTSDVMPPTLSEGTAGVPWFEEMIEGSRLGRAEKTRRGIAISGDGRTRVEWEVSEFDDEAPGTPRGKRKLEEDIPHGPGNGEDVQMRT